LKAKGGEMTLRHLLADIRLFMAFFLALLGFGIVVHPGEAPVQWLGLVMGSVIGSAGFTAIFLIGLAATAGEK
jgi:hypothetical protein